MARIAGVDIPNNKRVEIALTYIYGIGRKSANDILAKTGVNPDTRAKDLTEDEVAKLRDEIENSYTVEGDLRRDVAMNIKRMVEINCYRGIRHRIGIHNHFSPRITGCAPYRLHQRGFTTQEAFLIRI